MRHTRRTWNHYATPLLGGVLLVACGSSPSPPPQPPASSPAAPPGPTVARPAPEASPAPHAPTAPAPAARVAPGRTAEERLDHAALESLKATAAAPAKMRAHAIDVGQGAATLFEFSCGAVLVDTGGETNGQFDSAGALRGYLDAFFGRREDLNRTIDLLVITHPHLDHARNAKLVAQDYTVKNVVTDGHVRGSGGPQQKWLQTWARANAKLETIDVSAVSAGGKTSNVIDPVKCSDEDPKLSVLWGALAAKPEGWSQEDFEELNNHSVALRIDYGAASFLVTGDLELKGIGAIVAKHQGTRALDVDVWSVSHHGSANATDAAMVDALTPLVALLGTGPFDRRVSWSAWAYGHPRKNVIDLLAGKMDRRRSSVDVQVATAVETFEAYKLSKSIYATGWDGTIVVQATRDGKYRVQTER